MVSFRHIASLFIIGVALSISWLLPGMGEDTFFSFSAQEAWANNGNAGDGASSNAGGLQNAPETDDSVQKVLNTIVAIFNILLGFITSIGSVMMMAIGWLLSPDWTSGDLFGLREPMYKLWTVIANIIYVIYAILIILIALATMFNSKNFGYKALLPKLALGIIMVPFTWWFIQWTISLASVVTASVISIPHEAVMAMNSNGNGWWERPLVPSQVVITGMGEGQSASGSQANSTEVPKLSPLEIVKKAGGMYSYMTIYAYGIFKLHEAQDLQSTGLINTVKTISDVFQQGVISIVMLVIFGILSIALAAILLVRAVMLWIYAIFSPLFSLKFVAGNLFGGKASGFFDIKQFVGLAFVPAVVSLALSMGLLVIGAVQQGSASTPTNSCDITKLRSAEGCTMVNIMGNPENKITRQIVPGSADPGTESLKTTLIIGGISIEYYGRATPRHDDNAHQGGSGVMDILNVSGGIFGTILVNLIALVFIWMAFMAAKSINSIVNTVAQPFEAVGSQVTDMAKKSVEYIPVPGVGSIGGMKYIGSHMQTTVENAQRNRAAESALGQLVGMQRGLNNQMVNALKEVRHAQNHTSFDQARSVVSNAIALGQGENLVSAHKEDIEAIRQHWKDHFNTIIQTNPNIQEPQKRQLQELINKDDKLNPTDLYKFLALISGRYTANTELIDGNTARGIVHGAPGAGANTEGGNKAGGTAAGASAGSTAPNTHTTDSHSGSSIHIGTYTININATQGTDAIVRDITGAMPAGTSYSKTDWETALNSLSELSPDQKAEILDALKNRNFITP